MKTRKPAWWQLYLLVPIMFVLLALQHIAPLPGVSDEVVDTGIVVFTFAAMLVWVKLNAGLVERDDYESDETLRDLKITVYEPAAKHKDDGESSDDLESFAIRRSFAHARGGSGVRLEEKDKWSHN